jgi:hypothetical protein
MSTLWVKIKSWHILREAGETLCGRPVAVPCPTSTHMLMDEKSCETCLRVHERNEVPDTLVDGWTDPPA